MDRGKNKGGMLAAGKKRLEQFRQKKGKGNSSKSSKQEVDLEGGRAGHTDHDHVHLENDRPVRNHEETNANLMIEVRVDDSEDHLSTPPAISDSYESTKVPEPGGCTDPGNDASNYVPQINAEPQVNVELNSEKSSEGTRANINVNDDKLLDNPVKDNEDTNSQVNELQENSAERSVVELSSHPNEMDLSKTGNELQSQFTDSCAGETQPHLQSQQKDKLDPKTDSERFAEPLVSDGNICDVSSGNVIHLEGSTSSSPNIQDLNRESNDDADGDKKHGIQSEVVKEDVMESEVKLDVEANVQITADELQPQSSSSCGGEIQPPLLLEEAEEEPKMESERVEGPLNSDINIRDASFQNAIDVHKEDNLEGSTSTVVGGEKGQESQSSTSVESGIIKGDVEELAVKHDAEDETSNETQTQSSIYCGGELHLLAEAEPPTDSEIITESVNLDVIVNDGSSVNATPVQEPGRVFEPLDTAANDKGLECQSSRIGELGVIKGDNVESEVKHDHNDKLHITGTADRSSNISDCPNIPDNDQTGTATTPDNMNLNGTESVLDEYVSSQAAMDTASASEPSSSEVNLNLLNPEEHTESAMPNTIHEEKGSVDEHDVKNKDSGLSRESHNAQESFRSGFGVDNAEVVVSLELNVGGKSEDEAGLTQSPEETSSSSTPVDSMSIGPDVSSQYERNAGSDLNSIHPVNPSVPLSEKSSAEQIPLEEKNILEEKVKELQILLSTKEAEIAEMTLSKNSLSVQENDQINEAFTYLGCLVDRLSHLLSHGLNTDKENSEKLDVNDDKHQQEGMSSITFEHLMASGNHWIDQLQKHIDEKREMEITLKHYKGILSRKDNEMEDLEKRLNDLQKDKEGYLDMENKLQQLEDLLSQKEINEVELSKKFSELSQQHNIMEKELEESREMGVTVKHLEELLLSKECQIEVSKSRIKDLEELLLSKELETDRLSGSLEEMAQMEIRVKDVEQLLSSKESELEKLYGRLVEMAQMETKAKDLEQLLSSKESDLESLSGRLEEMAQMETKAKDLEQLLSSKESDLESLSGRLEEMAHMETKVKDLEQLLSSKESELEKLYGRLVEMAQMETKAKDLEQLLSSKESDLESHSGRLEEMAHMETKVKDLEQLLSSKESELEKLYGRLVEMAQMETKAKDLEQLLSSKESDLESLSGRLEEMAHMETKVKDLEQLLSSKESDLVRLSEKLEEMYQMETKATGLEQLLFSKESDLVNLSERLEEEMSQMETKVKDLEQILSSKESDLTERLSELSRSNDELQKTIEEKSELENKVRDLESLLTLKQTDTEGLSQRLVDLSEKYADLQRNIDAKSLVESQVQDLENLLSVKDTHMQELSEKLSEVSQQFETAEKENAKLEADLSNMKALYVEKDAMYSNISSHLDALFENISSSLGHDISNNVENSVHGLESCIVSLLNQNESLRESQHLLTIANNSEMEMEHLKSAIVTKENEISNLHDQMNLITSELNRTREDYERKLSQSEEKLQGVREKLSLAVTKGKGLLQQRDNLKQLLAEKTSELENLTSSYNQELHLKVAALDDAENKVKLYAESVERVEALESELSYIRNSANTLRESFLQKDAVLQKIEELLDDANLPDELQIKDSFEKVEWLIETLNQKALMFEAQSLQQASTLKESELVGRDQDVLAQEFKDLNKKYDDLLHKYREMAEQSAMLEQSLLERNLLIQRWEEVLESIEMPPVIRSKEPEDRIEWLGKALSDAHGYASQLQIESESLNMTIEDLSRDFQKLQADKDAMLHELESKNNEIKMMAMSLEDVTAQYDTLSKNMSEQVNVSSSREPSQVSGLKDRNEDGNEPTMLSTQSTELNNLLNNVQTMLVEVLPQEVIHNLFSVNTGISALENSVQLLIENHKSSSLEATNVRGKLEEVQMLCDDLSLKIKDGDDLRSKTEELHSKNSSLEHEAEGLKNHVNSVTEELSLTRAELSKLQMEASQSEEKIGVLREKLSMAIKKGKSVVQQRDSLKQSLEEATAELNEKIREQEAMNLALGKADQKCKHLMQTVEKLEADLSLSREYTHNLERSLQESHRTLQRFAEVVENATSSGGPRSGDIMEKAQWLSQALTEAQRKTSASEQETKKAKKTAELLSLDLEELHGRMDSVKDELAHAENNILTLTEQKKAAEAARAEAGLRLEHAMANINSLVFELSEARESQGSLERENGSLKNALSSQMEEIRLCQTKAEEHLKDLTDLYSKIHSLREFQANLFKVAVDNFLKMSQETNNTKALALRFTEDLSPFIGTNANRWLTETSDAIGGFPSSWNPKNSLPEGNHLDWEHEISMGSLKLECADMEDDMKSFFDIFQNMVTSVSHDATSVSQMLLEMRSELRPMLEKMETHLGDGLLEKIKNLFGDVQSMQICAFGKTSSPEFADVLQMSGNDMRSFSFAIIEHLCTSVRNLVSFQEQKRIECESHNQLLQGQLDKAKELIDYLDQQQQLNKVQINDLQKCVDELQSETDALRSTNQELHSLHEDLLRKGQGEKELLASLGNSEAKVAELSAKVEELNKSKNELEVSLSKASGKLVATVNNFNKFKMLSEKLIEEAESLHLLLEGRDKEISQLRNELDGLQNLFNQKTADLSLIYQEIKQIVARNNDNSNIPRDSENEARAIKELLKSLSTVVHSGTEDLRIQLARKDALLQDMQMRHDELSGKMNLLQASLLENQRLMEERESSFVADRISSSTESDEVGSRLIATPAAIVTRGRKLPVSDHVAVDVVAEPSRSTTDSEDIDDKGHAFKPLTSSRLFPRGTRFLVDRIDGFWVSGERLLMRRPDARIAVMLYWLSLHIWMAMLLL